jgi:hypothetical protein
MVASEATRQPGLAYAVLALGGFAIGTTEFATMSFLPAFTSELGVVYRRVSRSSAPMRLAPSWARRCWLCASGRRVDGSVSQDVSP